MFRCQDRQAQMALAAWSGHALAGGNGNAAFVDSGRDDGVLGGSKWAGRMGASPFEWAGWTLRPHLGLADAPARSCWGQSLVVAAAFL